MRLFTIKCHNCGDQNPYWPDDKDPSSIKVYFHKGTPSIMDRMVFYCSNCGNKEEYGIMWPLETAFATDGITPKDRPEGGE